MTWNELADSIEKMTEEERQSKVKFFEACDDGVILNCVLCHATLSVNDSVGGEIKAGEWYLF